MRVGALDDFDLPTSCGCNRLRHFRSLISGVGKYPFDEGKAPPHTPQQIARAIAVLNVGGQNAHAEQETERVDEDVTLAPRNLLAHIEALRVNRRTPF